MLAPSLSAKATALFIIFSSVAAYASDGVASLESRAPATQEQGNANSFEVTGTQSLGRNKVDGVDSTRTKFKSIGVEANTVFNKIQFGFDVTQLSREASDKQASERLSKITNSMTPRLTYALSDEYRIFIGGSFVRTKVENNFLPNEPYNLHTSRTFFGMSHQTQQDFLSVTFLTEAEAKKSFDAQNHQIVDRDYVPAQADLTYVRPMADTLTLKAGMRYSHYNNDVYKDQYDSKAHVAPNVKQALDNLLSFNVGASYFLNQYLDFTAQLLRKAELDVNSYTGDEYVVSYTGLCDVVAHLTREVTIGLGTQQSAGKKTHEVKAQSYDYASKLESYRGFVAVAL